MLEGASFLLLLFVAMPLKYMAGEPGMVRVVGMAHGVLFVLYLFAVLQAHLAYRWPLTRSLMLALASVLPFGPFWVDARILRKVEGEAATQTSRSSAS